MKRSVVRLSVRPIIRPPHAAAAGLLLLARRVIAKFHYTDTDTDPTRTGPDQTKSAHIVGYELNSTTRTRHGPDRTRPDPHGPARTFFVAKLRWVRAGPVGPV